MLYMDLAKNDVQLFTGEACFGQKFVCYKEYLGVGGGFIFLDTQGMTDPAWSELNSRYILLFFSSTAGVPALQIPLQAVPVQSLSIVLNGENYTIGLYDQLIATALPPRGKLPVDADSGYINQQFLAPLYTFVVAGYVDPGYWDADYTP